MKRSRKSIARANSHPTSPLQIPESEQTSSSLWHEPFVHVLLILVTSFAVYYNTINVPFIFDDFVCLVNNPAIRSFDCFPDTQKVFEYTLNQDIKNNLILRPVAYFSFAVNYAIHGLGLFGYHIVNLFLHVGCGLLLYTFFVQLMSTPAIVDENSEYASQENIARYLALFAALLFVSHPLQTQAVTYIIQRFVPLATFFYLAALVLYLEFRLSSTRTKRAWTYVCSLTATILAMESKEIAFTLPLILSLVEFLFLSGNIKHRLAGLLPFMLTMAIIPLKLMNLSSVITVEQKENVTSGLNLINFTGISSWEYLLTQFGVITTYIRLLFLPIRQNLDYDYQLQKNFFSLEVLLPLALLLVIAGFGISLMLRAKKERLSTLIAFGIFWFFTTLSVESSIVPIEDLIFEHRAYLPSIGFFISLLAGVALVIKRLSGQPVVRSKAATLLLSLAVLVFSSAAILRNMVWLDEIQLWSDVVSKSPGKPRPYISLGVALTDKAINISGNKSLPGESGGPPMESVRALEAAIFAYKKSISLDPNILFAYLNLAAALSQGKRHDEALFFLSVADERHPKNYLTYVTRGEVFDAKGDFAQARQEYLKAVELSPGSHLPHLKLADSYLKGDNRQGAINELEIVLRINPDEAVRHQLERLKAGQILPVQ